MSNYEEVKAWWIKNGCKGRVWCSKNSPFEITETSWRFLLIQFKSNDQELTDYSTKLAKSKQKAQDTNRIERKAFRENSRIENALTEYNKELVNNFKLLKPITIKHKTKLNKAVGIIQISDTHFNELINIEGNKYDFKIASRRLKLLCDKSKIYFKAQGIKNVLIAFTGDIMNSDRRLDELLNQATNRAKATLLSCHILESFIIDLNKEFNVTLTAISGNESRANEILGYSDIMATDNYDFTIFNMLKMCFRGNNGITFIDGDFSEKVVEVAEQNILLLHGLSIKGDIEKSIQQIIGKYAHIGKIIDYVLIGHIHSCRIGDMYARSSGMCGGNAYSNFALNLSSRASQNIGIFYDNKSHDIIKIDLQITDNVQGYDIIKQLEAYNAKSVDKCKTNTPIFKVVI